MEHLVKSFTRVLRGIDKAEDLIQYFSDLENRALSDPSSINEQDRRRILEIPEPETQQENIGKCSKLEKTGLVKRAAETPNQLTTSEIDLLKERYWLDISPDELLARAIASSALLDVSMDHWREVTDQLKAVRASLCEPDEAKAIENAEWEDYNRRMASMKASQTQEVESKLSFAQPWVRQLWEEDRAEKPWGYATFYHPEICGETLEDFLSRRDGVLFWARGAIGCGDTIGARWQLQRLEWPERAEEATEETLPDFRALRKQFKAIRAEAPERQSNEAGIPVEVGGVRDGILRNVFLVFDAEAKRSVLSQGGMVDDMWCWAVDPDYDEDKSASSSGDGYRGFLRVRLQQLVNNFFEARRFREEEYSMEDLWRAAQKSKNKAFVSTKDSEAGLWKVSRDVGSAVRST